VGQLDLDGPDGRRCRLPRSRDRRSKSVLPPNDFYCAVGAGAENSANGILLALLFLAWVVAWLVGLGVIRLLVRLRDRRRQRRQIQQLEMRREEMHIKL